MSSPSTRDIEALVAKFRESGWREMHLVADGVDLFLSKDSSGKPMRAGGASSPGMAPSSPSMPSTATPYSTPVEAPPRAHAATTVESGTVVRAPSLGTFYRSPKPGAPSFCEAGQHVDADSQLCLIEVMKLFTTVRAGVAGSITQIYVADGDMVEFDQPLFMINADG